MKCISRVAEHDKDWYRKDRSKDYVVQQQPLDDGS
jgi:hypothetical protein